MFCVFSVYPPITKVTQLTVVLISMNVLIPMLVVLMKSVPTTWEDSNVPARQDSLVIFQTYVTYRNKFSLGQPGNCQDIDECTDGSNNCDINAECTNVDGGFECACNAGFTGSGETCVDIDECSDPNLNICHTDATCSNNDGGFECTCNEGFIGDGLNCELDLVDECSVRSF